jgi:hypothetical protein
LGAKFHNLVKKKRRGRCERYKGFLLEEGGENGPKSPQNEEKKNLKSPNLENMFQQVTTLQEES